MNPPNPDPIPTTPHLSLSQMSEQEAEAISGWQYPAPYDSYKWPSWAKMLEQGLEFGDPHFRQEQYLAVHDQRTQQLVGYIQLFPLGQTTTRIGMGLRPDCCDLGWGSSITKLAVEEASRRQPGAEIDLEVEKWNKRAIRAYEKADFITTDEYEKHSAHGQVSVFCMVWHNL